MEVRLNVDSNVVAKLRKAIAKCNGYCPCVVEPTEDDFCMCKDFRDKVNDPNFEGYCHCRLYYKAK